MSDDGQRLRISRKKKENENQRIQAILLGQNFTSAMDSNNFHDIHQNQNTADTDNFLPGIRLGKTELHQFEECHTDDLCMTKKESGTAVIENKDKPSFVSQDEAQEQNIDVTMPRLSSTTGQKCSPVDEPNAEDTPDKIRSETYQSGSSSVETSEVDQEDCINSKERNQSIQKRSQKKAENIDSASTHQNKITLNKVINKMKDGFYKDIQMVMHKCWYLFLSLVVSLCIFAVLGHLPVAVAAAINHFKCNISMKLVEMDVLKLTGCTDESLGGNIRWEKSGNSLTLKSQENYSGLIKKGKYSLEKMENCYQMNVNNLTAEDVNQVYQLFVKFYEFPKFKPSSGPILSKDSKWECNISSMENTLMIGISHLPKDVKYFAIIKDGGMATINEVRGNNGLFVESLLEISVCNYTRNSSIEVLYSYMEENVTVYMDMIPECTGSDNSEDNEIEVEDIPVSGIIVGVICGMIFVVIVPAVVYICWKKCRNKDKLRKRQQAIRGAGGEHEMKKLTKGVGANTEGSAEREEDGQ